MGATLQEMMDRLSDERREKIEKRSAELIAEEMTLCDLRRARTLTQQRLAEKLKVRQDSISRLEKRSDLMLSTLRGYVAAMGGELVIVALFPDRPPVAISGLAGLDESSSPDPHKGKSKHRSTSTAS